MYWQMVFFIINIRIISGLKMSLSLKSPTFSGSLFTIKCKTESKEKAKISLEFPNNVKISYDPKQRWLNLDINGKPKELPTKLDWYNASNSEEKIFPFIKSIHVLSSSMQVMLRPTPEFSGNIMCEGTIPYRYRHGGIKAGEKNNATALLDVFWSPTVLKISATPSPLNVNETGSVTCVFRVSSKFRLEPKFFGSEDWKLTKNVSSPLPNGHAANVTYTFEKKVLTRADNGVLISCSIGNSSKETTLDVRYSAKLTLFPSNNEMEVGSTIRCEAKANPPVNAKLRIVGPGEFKKTILCAIYSPFCPSSVVKYTIPLTAANGTYTATCFAEDDENVIEKRSFRVIKRPLKVMLAIKAGPLKSGRKTRIACYAPDRQLELLEMRFQFRAMNISKNSSQNFSLVRFNGNPSDHIVRQFPKKFDNVELKSVKKGQLEVVLTPSALYDKTSVTCLAMAPNFGRESTWQKETFEVHWDPSVLNVSIVNGANISENRKVTVWCKAQLGHPESQIKASIGGRNLMNPSKSRSETSQGIQWYEFVWHDKVSREDDEKEVVCRVGEDFAKEKFRVRYAPRDEDIVISPKNVKRLEVGDQVTCSTKGSPLPTVLLRIEPASSRSWRENPGSVTLTVSSAQIGNVTIICEVGEKTRKVPVEIVAARRAPKQSKVFIIVFCPIVVQLSVLVVLGLCMLRLFHRERNNRSCRSNSSQNGKLHVQRTFSREARSSAAIPNVTYQVEKKSTSTPNGGSDVCLISESERETELTYAVLYFGDDPKPCQDMKQDFGLNSVF